MAEAREHPRPFQLGRLRRRHLLSGAVRGGAGLAALGLLGCSAGPKPSNRGGRTEKEPQQGGMITRHASPSQAGDRPMDPHRDSPTFSQGYRLIYQGLLGYHLRTYTVEPELAQSWEQPSETEYIFRLQPGVRWQDKPPVNGRELTIEDILFSLERVRTDEPQFFSRSILEPFIKIEATDKSTLKFTTNGPDAPALLRLASDGVMVMAPELVQRAKNFLTPDELVGTGAFIITFREIQVGTEYVRNPTYWKRGRPYLDGIRTRAFQDEQFAYAAFLAGQLDLSLVPGIEVKNHIARQGADSTPYWFTDDVAQMVYPNTRVAPFGDRRVIRALRLLMDHQEFLTAWAEVAYGRGRYGSVFTTALEDWDLTHEEYAKHLFWRQPKDEAAREALTLLSAAGFTAANPLKFELVMGDSTDVMILGQLIHASWKRLSQGVVDVTLRPSSSAEINRRRSQGTFQCALTGLAGTLTEPDAWLTDIQRSGASRNYARWSDPEADALIDRQRRVLNLSERKALVRQALIYLIDNSPYVIPANRYQLMAVKPGIRDYTAEGNHIKGRQYEWVWLDSS